MPNLLALIRKSGIDVSQCHRVTLDTEDIPYYSESDSAYSDNVFEDPPPGPPIKSLEPLPFGTPSLLRYFIDGSRRLQKVAEIVVGGRFYPMLAGQIGVAVTKRSELTNRLAPERSYCKVENVLALPNKLGDELQEIEARILQESRVPFRVIPYDPTAPDRNPNDLAVIAIMTAMLDLEIDMVTSLAASGDLTPGRLLVRDGPLQFRRAIRDMLSFEHVIGISKSFSTNAPIKRGVRPLDVGSLVKDLDLYDRTKCYRLDMQNKTVAFWYLRIHRKSKMPNPLDGVIKIEKIAQRHEIDKDGLDSDLVDAISRHICEERNVTAYGIDRRWANHIYPIYLTERYIKATMDSEVRFGGYFKETQ